MSASVQSTPHLLFIDNIRILLTCFVIFVHVVFFYLWYGDWDYNTVFVFPLLMVLLPTILLGFFLMISAYFVPHSLKKKGTSRFIHDRLMRLGIPILIMYLIIYPVYNYLTAKWIFGSPSSFVEWCVQTSYFFTLNLGQLWFVFVLLVFTLAYVGVKALLEKQEHPEPQDPRPFPTLATIIYFALFLAGVTFCFRIFFPIGYNLGPFATSFPYFPQYIALFIIGIYAAGSDWFVRVPQSTGRACALLALLLIFLEPLVFRTLTTPQGPILFRGGLYWESLMYALWEQLTCILSIIGLVWIFHNHYDHQGSIAKTAAADTYAVFITHPLIILPLIIGIKALVLPPVLRFLLASALALPLCFIFGHLVRSIPGANRIL